MKLPLPFCLRNIRRLLLLPALTALALQAQELPEKAEPLPPKNPPAPTPAINPLISKIALGSCSHQERPQPVLRTVLDYEPDLFIYLGDNIYGDTRDMTILQEKYNLFAARKEFQALRHSIPTIATWDDHDYGENDAGREYPMKAQSKQVFLKFWNEPSGSPRYDHPGIYTSYVFEDDTLGKRLQVILLDTRTFRTPLASNPLTSWKNDYHPDPNPQNTILGETQWAWLKEQFEQPADLRIVGTSIQFGHEYNGWESWTNFPSELMKMVQLIKETRANGVVFISGDVHWGELSVLKPKEGYPLHDLTASGINQEWDILEPNRNRHGKACMDHHFGMIEVDWEAADPRISLRIHDITGRARVKKNVRLSELQFNE